MNAIASLATKAVLFTALGTSLSGCALGFGVAAIGAGASLLAIDESSHGPHMSGATVQTVENSEASSAVADLAQEIR